MKNNTYWLGVELALTREMMGFSAQKIESYLGVNSKVQLPMTVKSILTQIGLGEDSTPINLKLMCTMTGRWLLKWWPLPIRAAEASLLVWQLTAPHPGLSVIATHLMQDYLPYKANLYA